MTQAASRNHWDRPTAGSDDRGEHQADFIAYASRGMFVDDGAAKVRFFPVHHLAGLNHCVCQVDTLVHRHSLKENRHGEGRNLSFGN